MASKTAGVADRPAPGSRDLVAALLSGEWTAADQAALMERNRAAIALLEQWRQEPPNEDEERWPELQAALEANRAPGERRLFSE